LATAELKKGDFPRLEFIDLNQNQFKSIPAALYAIVNLKRMMLWDNAIAFVPKGISRLKNLESLELQNNKLITIPLELTNLKKLECLDMEGNNLAIIPHELIKMKKLKELTLTGNNLTTTGIKPLYKMYWLTTLDLQANKITYVDKKIKSLKNLHVLHLSNNPLIILPDEILELKKLQWLGIGQLPNLDWDKTFKMLAQMPSLNKLSLFYDGFKTIPPGFEKLKQINFFIMNGNGISDQDEQRIKQMFPNATINLD
jgi:leucine-rich repeat protein SHOC2